MNDPEVLSPTKQRWDGATWYLCGFYFSMLKSRNHRVALHRSVWERAHGPIPDGHHVHHINGDRADNRLDNLQVLACDEHLRMHMTPERREAARQNMIENVMPKAAAWHSTDAGRAWHSQNGRNVWVDRPYRTVTCEMCGASFQTRASEKQPRYTCSNNCKQRRYRAHNLERMRQYERELRARGKSSASPRRPSAS